MTNEQRVTLANIVLLAKALDRVTWIDEEQRIVFSYADNDRQWIIRPDGTIH